jgi:autotransporter-associated beta strand protein
MLNKPESNTTYDTTVDVDSADIGSLTTEDISKLLIACQNAIKEQYPVAGSKDIWSKIHNGGEYGAYRLTINQLNTATWTGAGINNNWSTAANWANNAVPLRSNVNNVAIPAGYSVNFDAIAADNANKPTSAISNNSTLVFNLSTAFNLANEISGTGSINQQGSGTLTISGRNTAYSGNTQINASRLHLANSRALGSGSVVTSGGGLSMDSSAELPSLNINGNVVLHSDIYTTGAQTYNGNLEIAANGNTRLETINSNISFNGTITAGSNSKGNLRSLLINAGTGTVTFNDRVGSDRGLYANFNRVDTNLWTLNVRAARIEIKADIMTFENQIYTGAVFIGNNGNNGFTRTLISVDPSIVFNGTVDDLILNTHTLKAMAIAVDNSIIPTLEFNGDVGSTQALAAFTAITGTQLTTAGSQTGDIGSNRATYNGTISIKGDVTTSGDQSYTANNIILGATGSNQLQKFTTTDNGNIDFNVGLSPNAISVKDDAISYSLTFDLGRGSLSAATETALAASGISYDQILPPTNIMDLLTDIKNQRSLNITDISNRDLLADVSIGVIDDAGDEVKCDSEVDEDCGVSL